METLVKDFLSKIEIGDAQEYKNMALVPLKAPEKINHNFLSLGEALASDMISITEVDKSGSVPNLKVVNKASTPVLLLDGEELIGAKQNRILNTTILLKENSETIVPVSCTEQGRWSYQSSEFADSMHVASSRVRRAKSASVNQSLKTMKNFQSNQGEVWEEIRETSHRAQVNSKTGALRDIYSSRENLLEDYLKSFELEEDQNGALFIINGDVMGMEVLYNKASYGNYHHKLVKSYALDAILEEKKSNTKIKENAHDFMKIVSQSQQASYPSVGHGEDYRFENKVSVGSGLVWNESIVHMAFFKKPDMGENPEIKLSRASHRASYRI